VRRIVDRWFALGLTFYPVVLAARAAGVGEQAAVWVAAGVVTIAAVALVAVGPSHASGDAWWFGLYTAVAFWAVVAATERWLGYPATDRLAWVLGVWLVSLAAAAVGVARRRADRRDAA
jgi:hypothetical protein